MVIFLDGPAAGQQLLLRRAPPLLRVVVDGATGKLDALDQLDDDPEVGEIIHVYQRAGDSEAVFLCSRGPGPSGRYFNATYRHVPDVDVDGEGLEHRLLWQNWCTNRTEDPARRDRDRDPQPSTKGAP